MLTTTNKRDIVLFMERSLTFIATTRLLNTRCSIRTTKKLRYLQRVQLKDIDRDNLAKVLSCRCASRDVVSIRPQLCAFVVFNSFASIVESHQPAMDRGNLRDLDPKILYDSIKLHEIGDRSWRVDRIV